jgi:hypothetical protein
LTGILPSGASLHGRFIADDLVRAIRLNGRNLKVPLQHEGPPFVYWSRFYANAGFVKGTNVLEVDVLNADPGRSPSQRRTSRSQVLFIMELEGTGPCNPGLATSESPEKNAK